MRLPRLQLKPLSCGLVVLLILSIGPTGAHARKLPIKSYTSADGLARDYIDCIIPDSHGFLWFCTPEGLSRFDGSTFVTYGPEQGFPQIALDVLEARDGTYWVATTSGACRFNLMAARESSTLDNDKSSARASGILASLPKVDCYQADRSERARVVTSIKQDRDGVIWCGTNDGLFRLEFTHDRWLFVAVDLGMPSRPPDATGISTILVDITGTLWVGANSGLYRRSPNGQAERYTTAQGLPSDVVRELLEDSNGRIWIGTVQGLGEMLPQSNSHASIVAKAYTTRNGLASGYINALHQSNDGRIWIGTDIGLTELVRSGSGESTFRHYSAAQGLLSKKVESLGEDSDGNLWIGTESNGAMRLARHGFVTYTEIDGLKDTRIASILEDALGHICVISSRAGGLLLHRVDGASLTPIKLRISEHIKRSWGWNQIAFQDRTRDWWVDTAEGLYRFPKTNGVEDLDKVQPATVYTKKDGLTGNEVFRLYEDRRGDIWISIADSLEANLARWERATGRFYEYGATEGFPSPNAPTAFREDDAGNLWIGFYYGGLVRYRAGQFTRFSIADGLPPGMIRDLYVDHNGALWVATYRGGLARSDNPSEEHPRFLLYTTREGLASDYVTCVTEDQQSRIYIGTPRGIDQLDPVTGRIKHYSEADGLVNNFINVAHRDQQGGLWFGTLEGLSHFIPEDDRTVSAPVILISNVRIGGEEQAFTNLGETDAPSLVLAPDRNQVQIDFVGVNFSAGETLRYQTKLDGADRVWSEPSLQRTVNYAQLAPGTYRFLVRAVKSDGTMSTHPAAISFRILAPVWQRWWFFTLMGLVMAGLGYIIYQYRVNRLLELERVRTRIATDLHDDIGSSLSRMAILSEVLKQDREVMPPASIERLTDIAETSRSLVDTMSDIVWSIDPRRDDLRSVILRVRHFASDVLESQGVNWKLEAAPELDRIKLNPEQRRHLFLIFKEAINNIARHARSTNVSLTIKATDHQLRAEISDDGSGFISPDSSHSNEDGEGGHGLGGHGLANMRTRAVELGGNMLIESNPGSGTKIVLLIPIGQRHGMNMLFSHWRK